MDKQGEIQSAMAGSLSNTGEEEGAGAFALTDSPGVDYGGKPAASDVDQLRSFAQLDGWTLDACDGTSYLCAGHSYMGYVLNPTNGLIVAWYRGQQNMKTGNISDPNYLMFSRGIDEYSAVNNTAKRDLWAQRISGGGLILSAAMKNPLSFAISAGGFARSSVDAFVDAGRMYQIELDIRKTWRAIP